MRFVASYSGGMDSALGFIERFAGAWFCRRLINRNVGEIFLFCGFRLSVRPIKKMSSIIGFGGKINGKAGNARVKNYRLKSVCCLKALMLDANPASSVFQCNDPLLNNAEEGLNQDRTGKSKGPVCWALLDAKGVYVIMKKKI